ncbi:MAG: hypothetical protein M0P31_13680 [Solirubrobacteraceae bacterium]|nr:hypothetical protein [Solirubrobacteraceae bacterium]
MSLIPMTPGQRDARQLGPILDEYTLERAVITALARRLPAWLDETNRQAGGDRAVERPRSWTTDDTLHAYPENQLPRVLVVAPSTVGEPVRRGTGRWTATFLIGVGAIVAHKQRSEARRKAAVYGAALRALTLHHVARELPQIAHVSWQGTGTGDLPDLAEMGRQIAVTNQAFHLTVTDIVDDAQGAPNYIPDPAPDGPIDLGNRPIVEQHSLTVERRP